MFLLDGTPQRALAIDFVPRPLLWYPLVLLAKDDINISTWKEADDPKYNWGVALGTSNDQFISRSAPKAQISRFQTNGENLAAFQAGRIDGMLATGPYADLNRARLKMGKIIVAKPAAALAAGTGIRYEDDARFKSFLTTSLDYLYNSGRTQELFDEQMKFRGLDPAAVTPVMREKWT
jgi:polar amino acid transport system substrate-binding protein